MVDETANKDVSLLMQNIHHIEEMATSLFELESYINESVEHAAVINTGIADKTMVAIRNLQFEDIVRQVADHANKKINILSEFIQGFTADLCEIEESDDESKANSMLDNLQSRLENITEELVNLPGRKPVLQENMGEGEVDLF